VRFRNDGSVNYRMVVAVPNGAGKTTFARRPTRDHSGIIRFVNSDPIASGPSPLRPIWSDIIPHYQHVYFDDSRHVEIKRSLWTVTTPVNATSGYRVVQYARNDALL
jgi:predicted ABC-type ATPase